MAGVICREIFGLVHVGLIRVLLFKEHNLQTYTICPQRLYHAEKS